MFRIGQTGKRQLVIGEVFGELAGIFRPGYQKSHISFNKFFIIATQLRQVRTAVRSGKAPVENQQHRLLAFELVQADGISLVIVQGEIRRR